MSDLAYEGVEDLEFPDDIALRSHFCCVPIPVSRIPHRETVVVFGNWPCKTRTGLLEQFCPFVRVEPFSREHRDKIFIPELCWITIRFHMVVIL